MTNAPIVGTFGCCALAVSGHAAAAPSRVMNVRRFIAVSEASETIAYEVVNRIGGRMKRRYVDTDVDTEQGDDR